MSKNDKKESKQEYSASVAEERAKELEVQKEQEKQLQLKEQIKLMESKKKAETMEKLSKANVEAEMYFDSWWVMRSKSIGKAHLKEVVRADMKARGLTEKESLTKYDEALSLYGVKLK